MKLRRSTIRQRKHVPKVNLSTIGLRRSERIKKLMLKKQGIQYVEIQNKTTIIDKTINKQNVVKQPVQLKKTVTNVSNNSENTSKNREKFYNEIARDEVGKYREKINLNPNAYNKDKYGNLAGNQFDLAMDNAFNGFYIAVLQFYNEISFDFKQPTIELETKGFKVHRWTALPSIREFNDVLIKSCQLWIISGSYCFIKDEYLEVIKTFFDSGKGVYIWGDNDPYYADANVVSKKLFGAEMKGNVLGDKVVGLQKDAKKAGLVVENIINTGVDILFEGITIATITEHPDLEPVMYGSDHNLVVASYSKDGKRAIIDGGFTRLYCKWDTAGTGRYVKNAAAWLANIENIPI